MAGSMPTNSNEFIEQQLNERLLMLEEAFESDVLTIVGPLVDAVDDLIRTLVEDMQQREGKRSRLAVILTTNGGFVETVSRVVDVFRHHYGYVSFIIPRYAFSAGTVLAMSGDDIFMDYYSRLGPIDPQARNARGRSVPALGYLKQWERLLEKAQNGTLTVAEAQLMIDGFDQAELYRYEQARELSVTLLIEWLVNYKFKNWTVTETQHTPVTPEKRMERAEQIARELSNTDRWHSHGYGISMAVLQNDLKLLIDDLAHDSERHERVKQYDGLLSDFMQKLGYEGVLHPARKFQPIM